MPQTNNGESSTWEADFERTGGAWPQIITPPQRHAEPKASGITKERSFLWPHVSEESIRRFHASGGISAGMTDQGDIAMSDMTREEIQAKIDVAESRIETKITEIGGDIKLMNQGIANMSQTVGDSVREQRSTRTTIIITAVVVVIALVAAVWQMQAGLLGAFQAGLTVKQISSEIGKEQAEGLPPGFEVIE